MKRPLNRPLNDLTGGWGCHMIKFKPFGQHLTTFCDFKSFTCDSNQLSNWGLLHIPNGISKFQENSSWKITKSKVCFDIRIKNDKIFFNKLFWNFDISDKKSADFSCLFTFFQMKTKLWLDPTTFWQFLKFWQKLDVCLYLQSNSKND